MTLVFGILILVCAIFLIIAVLLQSSKNHRMSGVVSGGAETFFGKQKGKTIDAKLSKATAVIAAIFALLVLGLYLVNAHNQQSVLDTTVDDSAITDTTEDTAETDETETDTAETDTAETDEAETEKESTEAEGETAAE